jgi:hypothetical protein
MTLGEETQADSRKKLLSESKKACENEQSEPKRTLDHGEDNASINDDLWGPFKHVGDDLTGSSFSWKAYSAAATRRKDVRVLLWLVTGMIIVVVTVIVLGLILLS